MRILGTGYFKHGVVMQIPSIIAEDASLATTEKPHLFLQELKTKPSI